MPDLNLKATFMAQLVKEAGRLSGETRLAKMLCYVETERGIKTGFTFTDCNHGNYTFEIKEEISNLVKEGLIEYHEEKKIGFYGTPINTHVFVATEKLKAMSLPLDDNQKQAVRSIFREFKSYTPNQIEAYDYSIYWDGKSRTDVEFKKNTLQETNTLIKKHKGDEEAALKEWLSK